MSTPLRLRWFIAPLLASLLAAGCNGENNGGTTNQKVDACREVKALVRVVRHEEAALQYILEQARNGSHESLWDANGETGACLLLQDFLLREEPGTEIWDWEGLGKVAVLIPHHLQSWIERELMAQKPIQTRCAPGTSYVPRRDGSFAIEHPPCNPHPTTENIWIPRDPAYGPWIRSAKDLLAQLYASAHDVDQICGTRIQYGRTGDQINPGTVQTARNASLAALARIRGRILSDPLLVQGAIACTDFTSVPSVDAGTEVSDADAGAPDSGAVDAGVPHSTHPYRSHSHAGGAQ
ncbi:MAG TPA: hypothetical protein VL588_08850 [Bdellovibrionota bacterium]|nr:hypothetical protein [Bdellovibrionota bacterium]